MTGVANTILVEPANGLTVVREKLAGDAITPGMLLQNAAAGTFVTHVGAGLNAQKLFALENVARAGGIADAYVVGETVRALYAQRGDLINAALAASATAIVIGDALESSGDGYLRKATADAATDTAQRDAIVAYAAEAVDNSGGGAGVRIQVEVA